MRVEFVSAEGRVHSTPEHACDSQTTMNFYVAGLKPMAEYSAYHIVAGGRSSVQGPAIRFTTPSAPIEPPRSTLISDPDTVPSLDAVLLQSIVGGTSIATDLVGNLIWYAPADLTLLTRAESGGRFLGIGEDGTKPPSQQFVREFDLAGITQIETNAERISEQLAAKGAHPINAFHHEAIKLPNGNYLVLAGSERILNDVQGPGPVDILGDTILVLDSNFQVLWSWDAFDHLDPHRVAIFNESCTYPATPACIPFFNAQTANDWLHGNSLQLTGDDDILYSARHQNWVIKIDYRNGAGNGHVLWRFGEDGDFRPVTPATSAWFSHQQEPSINLDNRTLTLFSVGLSNATTQPTGQGRVFEIDQTAFTAELTLNANLTQPVVTDTGSAQPLSNGNYHFHSVMGLTHSQSVELTPVGALVFGIQVDANTYRTFRMADLYTPDAMKTEKPKAPRPGRPIGTPGIHK